MLLTKTESGLSFRHIELLWYDVKQDQEKIRLAGSKGSKTTQAKNKALLEAPLKQLEPQPQSELKSNININSSNEVRFEKSLWDTNVHLVKNRIWEKLINRKGSMIETATALCELEEEGANIPSPDVIVDTYNDHCEEVASTNQGSYQYC